MGTTLYAWNAWSFDGEEGSGPDSAGILVAPANTVAVNYNGAADKSAEFSFVMPDTYGGGQFTCYAYWFVDEASPTNNVFSEVMVAAMTPGTDNYNRAYASSDSVKHTFNSGLTQDQVEVQSFVFVTAASRDNAAVGDWIRIKVRRDGTHASDTSNNETHLIQFEVRDG